MAKLLLLVFVTLLGLFTSDAFINGNLCQRQVISLHRQPIGSLHIIVPDVNTDCTIELHTQWGFSVVLSIYQYDIPDTHLLSVEDSDGYKISLLGKGLFANNKKSIISEGTMKIRYFVDKKVDNRWGFYDAQTPSTINETETELEDNSTDLVDVNNTVVTIMNETAHSSTGFGFFNFIYTQVGNAPCGKSEFACQNGKCLPQIYVCSGYNRCGDNSDNNKCGPQPTVVPTKNISPSSISNQTVILICTGLLVIALLTTAYIIVLVGKYKKSGNPNNSTPLQSVSSDVDVPTEQPPRVPEDVSASMCSRVQHFFQKKDDKVEENLQTLPSERFEVPSMYPSLQPTAPECGNTLGRENRGFSVERE